MARLRIDLKPNNKNEILTLLLCFVLFSILGCKTKSNNHVLQNQSAKSSKAHVYDLEGSRSILQIYFQEINYEIHDASYVTDQRFFSRCRLSCDLPEPKSQKQMKENAAAIIDKLIQLYSQHGGNRGFRMHLNEIIQYYSPEGIIAGFDFTYSQVYGSYVLNGTSLNIRYSDGQYTLENYLFIKYVTIPKKIVSPGYAFDVAVESLKDKPVYNKPVFINSSDISSDYFHSNRALKLWYSNLSLNAARDPNSSNSEDPIEEFKHIYLAYYFEYDKYQIYVDAVTGKMASISTSKDGKFSKRGADITDLLTYKDIH